MILSDFHVHTRFCDGHNAPEEIVLEAISRGMKKLGFSGHSHTPFDEGACMSIANTELYRAEISRLKAEYANQIEILCGIEQDYYSDMSPANYDYVIGSVHYIKRGGEYLSVDDTPAIFESLIRACNNDVYEAIDKYYSLVAQTKANIIGHFDLITKFNANNKYFDENDERYINSAKKALDILLERDSLFEINTGGIAKGYKQFAYPSLEILKYIAKRNGRVILSSDSHDKKTLMYKFNEYENLALSLGLKVCEL